jgi:hypothetical protein
LPPLEGKASVVSVADYPLKSARSPGARLDTRMRISRNG